MIQLHRTRDALGKLGIETEYSGEAIYPHPLLLRHFDVIHNFNFSMKWSKYQTWVAKKHRKPLVYSMIYHEGDQFVTYKEQQLMADVTDALIFLTPGEIERAKRHLTLEAARCHVIPNGVDAMWFEKPKGAKLGLADKFVLTVGRVEPSKGQLSAAIACKRLGIQYVMIGQRTDEGYTQQCEQWGAIHLPPMKPAQLLEYYAKCSAFVLASAAEVQPLSVMEAMAQGAQVILTEKCEWETPNVLRCTPMDQVSVEAQLVVALERKKNLAGIKEMKGMTWDNVALKLKHIYESLCDT